MRQTDRQAGRQADRQTDRRAGRQAGRQTDRQRNGLIRALYSASVMTCSVVYKPPLLHQVTNFRNG